MAAIRFVCGFPKERMLSFLLETNDAAMKQQKDFQQGTTLALMVLKTLDAPIRGASESLARGVDH
jgi:hypothetical protein